jgi:hypothetical protein
MGVCGPAILGPGVTDFVGLDATDVYWNLYNPSEIVKCSKSGCNGTPTSFWKDPNWSLAYTNLAFDNNNVYWFTSQWVNNVSTNKLVRCAKSGCNGAPVEVYKETAPSAGPFSIAIDNNDIYWADDNGGTVKKCAIGGCNNSATTLASSLTEPRALHIDATNIYWTTLDTSGAVLKCAKSGCNGTPTTLASAQNFAMSLQIDGTNVYWGNYLGAGVMKCSLGGCNGMPAALETGSKPWAIAIDSKDVYWSDLLGDKILRCSINGCNQPETAVLYKTPGALAVDAKAIYWGSNSGSVMVMTK